MGQPALTIPQITLVAARDLPPPFSIGDLAVAGWRLAPDRLRLRTALMDCPDPQKVSYTIHGQRGLAARGWLVRTGEDAYALTDAGRAEADRIAADPRRASLRVPAAPGLPRVIEKALRTALDSRAFSLYQMGLGRDVTWTDALGFWGTAAAAKTFAAVLDAVAERGDLVMRDRRAVAVDDLRQLRSAHDRFAERFARQLDRG